MDPAQCLECIDTERLLQNRTNEGIASGAAGIEGRERFDGQAGMNRDRTLFNETAGPAASSSTLLDVGLAGQGEGTPKQVLQMLSVAITQVQVGHLGPTVGNDERLQRPCLVIIPAGFVRGHQADFT